MQPSTPTGDPAAAVESLLADELADRRAQMVAVDPRLADDVDRLIAYVFAGGKRLRPQFLCWGWVAAQDGPDIAAPPGGVISAAAALELIQACALIHDDVIDRSDTRRGRPSIHRAVQKVHADRAWVGDSAHYGVSSAVLMGDLALAWADDLFADGLAALGSPSGAAAAWRAMRTEVLAGQLLDLRISADESADPEVAAADAMVVNRYKTAAYTVERPLHLGAALAGADDQTIDALREYGRAVGTAFQLRDDLLGVFGDPAVTGKPAGGDLTEGKKTVLLALARSDLAREPTLLRELDQALGTALTPEQVERLTTLVAGTGAPVEIESRIAALFNAGTTALGGTTDGGRQLVNDAAVGPLRSLALAATSRDR